MIHFSFPLFFLKFTCDVCLVVLLCHFTFVQMDESESIMSKHPHGFHQNWFLILGQGCAVFP